MASHVNWKGPAVAAKVRRASVAAINETMGDAVGEAKSNHGGWNNVSGNAEGSIQVTEPAALTGARIVGRWGSVGVDYFIYLEFWHGHALHESADVTYPTLAERIRRRI